MKHYQEHTLPTAFSSDVSDSEDMYGGSDTDDIHPSSDSELVSHPSDNEDHPQSLSVPASPSRYTGRSAHALASDGESDGEVDHERMGLPPASFSSQDLNQHSPSRRLQESKMQDDFFLVEPSDLDPLSRSQSSLSYHSDHSHHDDPMHFIYPSMVLSPPIETHVPRADDAQEPAADKVSDSQDKSHLSLAHDTLASVDSSMETLSGALQSKPTPNKPGTQATTEEHTESQQEQQVENEFHQDTADESTPLSGTVELVPVHALSEDIPAKECSTQDDLPPAGDSGLLLLDARARDAESPKTAAKTTYQSTGSPKNKSPAATRTLFERPAQEPSAHLTAVSNTIVSNTPWAYLNVLATCVGLFLVLLLSGFLAAKYHVWSARPAHVEVYDIQYSGYTRLAVVELRVYTAHFKQETRWTRPPGFHIRVLDDKKPWSLEEAPSQQTLLFVEPMVTCVPGGYCTVYVPSLQGRTRSGLSPWLCSDKSYYLHIWFANGTRALDTPPEIFTNRGNGKPKPRECLTGSGGFFADKNGAMDGDDEYDDYVAYWKGQLRHMADVVTDHCSSLSSSMMSLGWGNIQFAISEAQDIVQVALKYSKQFGLMAADTLLQWRDLMLRTEDDVLDRARVAFIRAQGNAKKITREASSRVQQLMDQFHGKRQFRPFDRVSAKSVLRKADRILYRTEEMLADVEERFYSSERVDRIVRKADKIVLQVETKVEQMLDSELARNVKRKMKRKLSEFASTPTGGKVVREVHAVKKDAKRLWRDVQKQLRRMG